MTVTVTLHLWWLWAYLAFGAVLWLPLEYAAWRSTHNPDGTFWGRLWESVKRHPYVPIIAMVLWPLAVWEAR